MTSYTKACSRCATTLPALQFRRLAASGDGVDRICKECRSADECERRSRYRRRFAEIYGDATAPPTEQRRLVRQADALGLCQSGERWLTVSGFPSYRVSDFGRIVGHHDRLLAFPVSRHGYRAGTLVDANGSRHSARLHVLVAGQFLGPRPDGLVINHKDGNKTNNAVTNLEYVTTSENNLHARRVLGKGGPRGSQMGTSVLSEADVVEIRRLRAAGLTTAQTAEQFGVSRSTIHLIVARTTWRHAEVDLEAQQVQQSS